MEINVHQGMLELTWIAGQTGALAGLRTTGTRFTRQTGGWSSC